MSLSQRIKLGPSIEEAERISELHSYSVLDTPPETTFDNLAKLAAYICGTPISLVSLVDSDRIWFKSKVGLEAGEIPRIDGFCSSAIYKDGLRIVPDASADKVLADHPLVTFDPEVRFYAGAPLVTPRGHRIGTLCVIDTVPRQLTMEQTKALENLAQAVIANLEARRSAQNFDEVHKALLELQARTEAVVQERTNQLALSNASLQKLSGQLIRAQDDERRRIARDLHDSTGQVLAALSMTIGQIQRESSGANLKRLEDCREMIASATNEIRNLTYLLHPPLMDEVGLASAIPEYAKEWAKRSGIRVLVEISTDVGRLNADQEIALFRVVQESLGNVHRHSGSSTAKVHVWCSGQSVVMEVRDQGRGLARDSGKSMNFGVGIRSMQERLRQLGGSLKIESDVGGTRVKAVLPRESPSDFASKHFN